MIRHFLKGTTTAFSLTLMLLGVVYTEQARSAREAAPTRIGETVVQEAFLVEYTRTRQELLMGFLREKFPSLDLPEADTGPENSLSLQALRDRNVTN